MLSLPVRVVRLSWKVVFLMDMDPLLLKTLLPAPLFSAFFHEDFFMSCLDDNEGLTHKKVVAETVVMLCVDDIEDYLNCARVPTNRHHGLSTMENVVK